MIKEQQVLNEFFISENKKLNKTVQEQKEKLSKLTNAIESLVIENIKMARILSENWQKN